MIHLSLSLAIFSKDPLTKLLSSVDSCDAMCRLGILEFTGRTDLSTKHVQKRAQFQL